LIIYRCKKHWQEAPVDGAYHERLCLEFKRQSILESII